MSEQRTRSTSTSQSTTSSSSSTATARPPRAPSVTSLRALRQPPYRHTGQTSRRQSVDLSGVGAMGESQSQPSSPITYFPNPSSFNQNMVNQPPPNPTTRSPSIITMSLPSGGRDGGNSSLPPSSSNSTDDEGELRPQSTPRLGGIRQLDSAGSSPKARRSSTLNGLNNADRRSSNATITTNNGGPNTTGGVSSSQSRTLSAPMQGYGSTHNTPGLSALGLGIPEHPPKSSTIKRDNALSSPRRISTSQAPSTAHVHRSPASLLNLPTHEAYYSHSQPATSSTPRFKDHALPDSVHRHQHTSSSQYPNSGLLHAASPARQDHRRDVSISSALNSPNAAPKSPSGSLARRLRKTASAVGLAVGRPESYDDNGLTNGNNEEDAEEEDEGMKANGTRVWYSSFVTIDWIHDAIKESARVRRLRHNARRTFRGSITNSWDRFQGWLVVTLIGFFSAIIAFLIIRAEMALFDMKEGFCGTSWGTAKRFCCAPHHRTGPGSPEDYECGDWIEWGEFFDPKDRGGPDGAWIWGEAEFTAYIIVAVALAVLAATMTIYLSSSDHHTTSKDSTFLIPSPSDPIDAKTRPKPRTKPMSTPPKRHTSEQQPLLESSTSRVEADVKALVEPPRKIMYYAAGSGIPEIKTILSGFVIHGYLGGWTLLTKSVGLALSVASGLSLGKEGPLVHISSCVGNIVSRLFIKFECNEAKRREVLSAACAAGVSVAFGAPIGGVLFSLEEVSYYFPPKVMWRSFWCAAVAAITLKGLNPFGNNSLVLFEVSYTKEYHHWEFAIFILLGVFGGLYGAVFSRMNILWSKHIRQGTWLKRHPIVEVLLVTVLTTILSFLNPYCRMGGTELVASLFAECRDDTSSPLCVDHPKEIAAVIWPIAMALLIKGALTIITFGIKVPAGIFIPSLVVGACFGRIVGLGMEWIEFMHPHLPIFRVCKDTTCVLPGLYAMIGAAATLAGVTRTTVSLAVIMLELTGTLNYVVPVMLAVLVAKTVADGLEKKSIYDLVIDLNQLPFLDSKHEYLWGGRQAAEIADKEVPILRADKYHTVRSLTGKLLELVRMGMQDSGFPVLVKEHVEFEGRNYSGLRIVGFLGMNELEHALSMLSDEPDANLNLRPDDLSRSRSSVMSIFSFAESFSDNRYNPYDISRYIDRAPITVQTHSPLELVQQLFVKLGARQLLVTDSRGVFRGLVTKKSWLAFLAELEEEGH